MKLHHHILSILIILLLVGGCKKIWPDDEFSITRENYNGNELRIDGYYYYLDSYDDYTSYFFYSNGVLLYGSCFDSYRLIEKEAVYSNGDYYDNIETYKDYWGLFDIDGNHISFEQGIIKNGRFKIYRYNGEIINDTSFIIFEKYRLNNNKEKEYEKMNDIYHFKQFSPKPDSTNSFIE